jgi:GntR family transcriptional regulator, transcriptional repressor for pyruvate dehydrogenase complex
MLSQGRPPRVYEQIVAHIERAIYEGRFQQGDKLPAERQLAREYGASRVAVREALRSLEHRGLVDVRQGSAGGYFIREVDAAPLIRDFQTLFRLRRASLAQLVEARLLIEPETARLAAQRANEADIKALRAAVDERGPHAIHARPSRQLDMDFHRLVAETAKNPVHAVLTHALMDLEMRVVAPRLEYTVDDTAAVDAAHRGILDAITARRPEHAAAAMEAHIADAANRLGFATLGRAAS